MKSHIIGTVACLALATSAAAQTVVFPRFATNAEGETMVSDFTGGVPWWTVDDTGPGTQNFRMQVIVDLPATMRKDLTEIAYRRDGTDLAGLSMPGFGIDLEVRVSTAQTTSATASPVFDDNVGTDSMTVISRQFVQMFSSTHNGTFPESFDYVLRFDNGVTFPYDGSAGSLCIDFIHHTNTLKSPINLTPLTVSADAMTSSTEGAKLLSGPRCAPPNRWSPPARLDARMFVDTELTPPRMRFHAWREHGEHHSQGFLYVALGLSANPIAAPYFPFLTPTPPPSCGTLEIDFSSVVALAIGNSDDFGNNKWPKRSGTYIFDVPYQRGWGGFQFFSQEMSLDIHTNQVTTSNFVINQIPVWRTDGSPFPVQVVHASGPGSHASTSGTKTQAGLGPVMRFR